MRLCHLFCILFKFFFFLLSFILTHGNLHSGAFSGHWRETIRVDSDPLLCVFGTCININNAGMWLFLGSDRLREVEYY